MFQRDSKAFQEVSGVFRGYRVISGAFQCGPRGFQEVPWVLKGVSGGLKANSGSVSGVSGNLREFQGALGMLLTDALKGFQGSSTGF